MAKLCAFIYAYDYNNGTMPICAVNTPLNNEGYVEYYTNERYYASIPLLSANLSRKTAQDVRNFSLGIVGGNASTTVKDNTSLYPNGIELDFANYANLGEILASAITVYVDFCIPKSKGFYTLATYIVQDYTRDINTEEVTLQLEDELLKMQKMNVELPLLYDVNSEDAFEQDPLFAEDTLTTSQNITDSILPFYRGIILTKLNGSLGIYDQESQEHFSNLVIPRPYHKEGSLWNHLQDLCEAVGATLFQSGNTFRIEYSYLLR